MSFFSGSVDENDHVRTGGYPAPFREMLGLVVEDFVPMGMGEGNEIVTGEGARYPCDTWADLIRTEGAEVFARYAEGFYAGTAALTRNRYGDGVACYLGTHPAEGYMNLVLWRLCREAGIDVQPNAPPGVEIVRRKTGTGSFLFVLNHNEEAVEVELGGPATDLLAGVEKGNTLSLEPFGAVVLREE